MEIMLAAATIVGGAAAVWFFWDKIAGWFSKDAPISAHDLKLYQQYKELFIDNGLAEFYRQHDFLAAFREDQWRPLSAYVDEWHTVEHEFVDQELNAASKKVYESAYELGMAIAQYTVSINNGQMRSVKSDRMASQPTPDHVKQEAREINSLTHPFNEAHKGFVRLANTKLYSQRN